MTCHHGLVLLCGACVGVCCGARLGGAAPAVGYPTGAGPEVDAEIVDSGAASDERIEIDVGKPGAGARWSAVTSHIGRCSRASVTIWYPFGSAALRIAPGERACQVELRLEVEMDRRSFVCALPPGFAWTWDLVSDAKGTRRAPPRELPPELERLCKKG